MPYLSDVIFKLPIESPVIIFTLILFVILFAPILLNRLKIPHLIGLIVAGAIIGPNGFNLLLRDSSIELFGTVGLLYIMFLAGLDIDYTDFRKNGFKVLVFGLLTFIIPMIIGTSTAYYLMGFALPTSVLLASMYASNTLITYPIINKLGIARNRAVVTTVGGTFITTTLALLVLAVIARSTTEVVDSRFLFRLFLSVMLFILTLVLVFPPLCRWFFKKYDDNIMQYIFVLAMVFLGALMAGFAGVEPIIGAFLTGLLINRLIPKTSPLMNRIEFVGNSLFIPFFLIGVGMLVDFKAFFTDIETLIVAVMMITVATFSKFMAAWLTQLSFKMTKYERHVIFGLSNAQAAATLAAVTIGYNIITGYTESGEAIRLLNESVLNGTVLMILFTCTIASFYTQKGAQQIAKNELSPEYTDASAIGEKILIPVSNPDNISELINLSITIKPKKNKADLYALHIINKNKIDMDAESRGNKMLKAATDFAAATDNELTPIIRYDLNVVNGIANAVRENKITDIVLGLHDKKGLTDSFLGYLTEGILSKCNTTTLIPKSLQPLATFKRHIIIVPENAEKEIGFPFWLIMLWNISRNTGAKLVFQSTTSTLNYLRAIQQKYPVEAEFIEFADWGNFSGLASLVRNDDNFIFILSRKNHPSYHPKMIKIPHYLSKYFHDQSFILIYPKQSGISEDNNISIKNSSVMEPLEENLEMVDEIAHNIARLFRKK